jgi:hypothetical protein
MLVQFSIIDISGPRGLTGPQGELGPQSQPAFVPTPQPYPQPAYQTTFRTSPVFPHPHPPPPPPLVPAHPIGPAIIEVIQDALPPPPELDNPGFFPQHKLKRDSVHPEIR